MITRRKALGAFLCLPAVLRADALSDRVERALADLEGGDGRLGVAILDTATGRRFSRRADERFPMCSTFKLLAAAAVLQKVDRGAERLERQISFSKADLLEYAPVTQRRIGEGRMPVVDLCEAAVTVSDNTAANLLLASLGGPAVVTRFARTIGDRFTRLDRNEPTTNSSKPGDPRDTTTPSSMIGNLERLVLGDVLKPASRDRLTGWLIANTRGDDKIRAGVPKECRVGDKTGAGPNGTQNDVAIVWPPDRKPFLIAAYLTATKRDEAARAAVMASAGRLAYRAAVTGTI